MSKIKYLFIISLILVLCSNSCGEKLLGMYKFEYYSYYGARVEQLLSAIKHKYKRYVFFSEPPGLLIGCSFLYPNGIEINVYVRKYKYIKKRFRSDANWDIELFKKETISKIVFRKVNY